ncbi:MAG: hypothetical protein IKP88_03300 [Lachnospiraceae bacterium]|nr:hypothetical protein [Lachnospiraceae bacterium]
MYACPNCSGNLKFNIEKQALYCDFCNNVVDPYSVTKERDAEEGEKVIKEGAGGFGVVYYSQCPACGGKREGDETVCGFCGTSLAKPQEDVIREAGGDVEDYYEVTSFRCPQCSGEIITEDNEAAAFCSFCGASTILDRRISRARRPEFIIPFKKTKKDCMDGYKSFMGGAFFAPSAMKSEKCVESFRGIYMPFWTYNTSKRDRVTVNGSRVYYRGDYKYTENHALSADVDMVYNNVSYDASSSFADNLSQGISPFNQSEQQPFTPSFLSGFYADTSDVADSVYQADAQKLVAKNAFNKFKAVPGFGRYGLSSSDGNVAKLTPNVDKKFLTMMPVWFMSIRSKDKKGNDRVSYTAVNGQTGKVVGDVPIDVKKYILASTVLSLIIFTILNFALNLTIVPKYTLIASTVVALIMAGIFSSHESDIVKRELGEDDKGLMNSDKNQAPENKQPIKNVAKHLKDKNAEINKKKEKSLVWIPLLIGGIILGLEFTVGLVSDLWFYGGSMLIMAYTVWLIIRVVSRYNQLTTRKLPQFNRTGGDDSVKIS